MQMTEGNAKLGIYKIAIIGITVLAFAMRYSFNDVVTGDMQFFLLKWYDYIVDHGGFMALADRFYDYSPPYIYLLLLSTYLKGFVSKVFSIKLISIVFDFIAATFMYKLIRLKYSAGPAPVLAYAAVLFAPTVIVNGSYWGQCDIIYSTWLLMCIYFSFSGKPFLSIVCASIALSFKAQAMFMAPFVLMLFLHGLMPWKYILIPPVVYMLMILPCAVAGRPLADLMTIYFSQAQSGALLSAYALNPYLLLNQIVPRSYHEIIVKIGLLLSATVALVISLISLKSRIKIDREVLLKGALLSVAMMPFILPKMHERYFFPADLLSIALAFYRPKFWYVPLLFQFSSIASYIPYLSQPLDNPIYAVRVVATMINGLLVALLTLVFANALFPDQLRNKMLIKYL